MSLGPRPPGAHQLEADVVIICSCELATAGKIRGADLLRVGWV